MKGNLKKQKHTNLFALNRRRLEWNLKKYMKKLREAFSWPIFSGIRRITDAVRRYILGLMAVILNSEEPNEISGRKFKTSF